MSGSCCASPCALSRPCLGFAGARRERPFISFRRELVVYLP
jgi:hypothetical protein